MTVPALLKVPLKKPNAPKLPNIRHKKTMISFRSLNNLVPFKNFQVTLERTLSEICVKLKTHPLNDNNWFGTLCNEKLNKYSINEIICYSISLPFYI